MLWHAQERGRKYLSRTMKWAPKVWKAYKCMWYVVCGNHHTSSSAFLKYSKNGKICVFKEMWVYKDAVGLCICHDSEGQRVLCSRPMGSASAGYKLPFGAA